MCRGLTEGVVTGWLSLRCIMHIDPVMRAHAASALLDAASVVDLEDDRTEAAEQRLILALRDVLDLETQQDDAKAVASAAVDLIWYLTFVLSQWRSETRETTIAMLRDGVLPVVYPEVYGDGTPPE